MADIKNNLIAKRYSDALFNLVESNNLDIQSINSQLKSVSESLNNSDDLRNFMSNPVMTSEQKKDVIVSILNGRVDSVIINFIKLLIDKERFFAFKEITESFSNSVDRLNNIQRVQVTSAIELKAELKNKLREKLSNKLNKNIELVMDIDKSIIAGLIIKINDNVIDMSLRHKFEELSKEMTT